MYTGKCFITRNNYTIFDQLCKFAGRRVGVHLSKHQITYCDEHSINTCDLDDVDKLRCKGFIDCGTNEDLFLAIAALRDDSDIHQWFVADEGIPCYCKKGTFFIRQQEYSEFHLCGVKAHKATVSELIEHFNK